MSVTRTSISLLKTTHKAGLARAKALGYDSFSDYLAFLINRDAAERPAHTTIRDETGHHYTTKTPGIRQSTIEAGGKTLTLYSSPEDVQQSRTEEPAPPNALDEAAKRAADDLRSKGQTGSGENLQNIG